MLDKGRESSIIDSGCEKMMCYIPLAFSMVKVMKELKMEMGKLGIRSEGRERRLPDFLYADILSESDTRTFFEVRCGEYEDDLKVIIGHFLK